MILLIYPFLCGVMGYIASQKGRSGLAWFLFSLLLSPLLGIIMVAVISSRNSATATSLESQVRDSMLGVRYAPYIHSHKPAFSSPVVHDVTFSGEKRRFKSKADAIAFCMINLPQELQAPAVPALRQTQF